MALNTFILRKYAALTLNGLLTVVSFFVGLKFYGLFIGIGCMLVALLVGVFIASRLLQTPFSLMMEGKGILALNMDSTGVINPFIVSVQSPYMASWFNKKRISDVFDRNVVQQLAAPINNNTPAQWTEDGKLVLTLDKDTYNKSRFALFHYPVLIYNEQINTFITKDFLSTLERQTFAEHGILYLNRKMEELTSALRDFGRHVIETLKPSESIFQNKWFWIIVAVFCGIMLVLFGPSLLSAAKGSIGGAGGLLSSTTETVTPR